MRGMGQIAELCEIAEPDVAAITNVGPVHLELLGTVEAIAEAKAEILAGLDDDGRAVVPADAEALEPHLADAPRDDHLRPGRRRLRPRARARRRWAARRARHPRGRGDVRAAVQRGPQSRQHRLRGGDRGRPRRRSRGDGTSGAAHILLAAARRAGPTARRCRARQRLLQRQPDLDGRGARPPRVARAAPVAGSPCSAGWPSSARTVPATTARPPPTRASSGSRRSSGSASSPATTLRTSGRRTARAAVEVVAGLLGEGDALLVKGSRSVGLEAFTDGLRARLGGEGGV